MDTSVSGFAVGPSRGNPQPHAGRQTENPAPVQFAAGFPRGEGSSVDFGTRSQTQPAKAAVFFFLYFFPDELALELNGELGKKKRKETGGEREEKKTAPRAGGRYCMHVHSSIRFMASCLRIFFLRSQDYPQTQYYEGGRERKKERLLMLALLGSTEQRHCQ